MIGLKDEKHKKYGTSDIGFAAALMSTGSGGPYLDKSDRSRILFIFDLTDELEEIQRLWSMDNLTLNARTLLSNFSHLKRMLGND